MLRHPGPSRGQCQDAVRSQPLKGDSPAVQRFRGVVFGVTVAVIVGGLVLIMGGSVATFVPLLLLGFALAETVRVIEGSPDEDKISTSYVERSNLTMRMGMRRMTRLTNAFSKKIENLSAAVALHFMFYNFARPHKTLGGKNTPAMAAGLSDHCWTVEEICQLLESN